MLGRQVDPDRLDELVARGIPSVEDCAESMLPLVGRAAPSGQIVVMPASFDYTGFNGRALGDNVMDNMLSVLMNSPLGTGIATDPGRIAEEFPFFSRPAPP